MIVPAYDEEDWLPLTLDALNSVMARVKMPGEVIVVDNNSTDRTPQIAADKGARVIFEPVNQISKARNVGAKASAGRYLFFLDADTLPSQALIEKALELLESGTCCGGGVRVSSHEAITKFSRCVLAFWNRLAMSFRLAAGCFIFCRREGFEAIGGFSEKVYAGEEILFSRDLSKWGKRHGLAFQMLGSPPVFTSLRKLKWLTPLQLMQLVLIVLFPVVLRFRFMCAFWYKRPQKTKPDKHA